MKQKICLGRMILVGMELQCIVREIEPIIDPELRKNPEFIKGLEVLLTDFSAECHRLITPYKGEDGRVQLLLEDEIIEVLFEHPARTFLQRVKFLENRFRKKEVP